MKKRRHLKTLLILLITATIIIVDSCATVYISEGNVKEKVGDNTEKHIGVTDDTIEIDGDKKQ